MAWNSVEVSGIIGAILFLFNGIQLRFHETTLTVSFGLGSAWLVVVGTGKTARGRKVDGLVAFLEQKWNNQPQGTRQVETKR